MRHSIKAVAALVLVSIPGFQAIPVGSSKFEDSGGLVPQHDLEPSLMHRTSERHHLQNHTIGVYGAIPRTREEQQRQLHAEEKEILGPLWTHLEEMLEQRVSQEVSAYDIAYGNRTDEMMVHAEGLFSKKGIFGEDSAFAKYRKCAENKDEKRLTIRQRVESNIVIRTRARSSASPPTKPHRIPRSSSISQIHPRPARLPLACRVPPLPPSPSLSAPSPLAPSPLAPSHTSPSHISPSHTSPSHLAPSHISPSQRKPGR